MGRNVLRTKVTPLALHTHDSTKNLMCDGKPCFEVRIKKQHYSTEIRYWCCLRRGYFQPWQITKCGKWDKHEND